MISRVAALAPLWLAGRALGQEGEVEGSGAQAGTTDAVVVEPLDIPFSPVDVAFREAMSWDPSFGSRERAELTQAAAADAWRSFLEQDDATKGQRVFAWWRIGSLHAYNFDESRGEKSDPSESARAFEQAWQADPDLISLETLNTCTVYATLPGSMGERVPRVLKAYSWLASRTKDMMGYSAARLGAMGYAVDAKFFPGGAYSEAPSAEQQLEMLEGEIEYARSALDKSIADMIQYSRPIEKTELLATLSHVADAESMARWQAIECRFRDANDRGNDLAEALEVGFDSSPTEGEAVAEATIRAGRASPLASTAPEPNTDAVADALSAHRWLSPALLCLVLGAAAVGLAFIRLRRRSHRR